MSQTKLQLIQRLEKTPVACGTALKMLVTLGTKTTRNITANQEHLRQYIENTEPENKKNRTTAINMCNFIRDVSEQEPEFVMDLMAMYEGHVSANALKEKYKDAR